MSLFGSGSFQNKDDQPTRGSSMWLVWLLSIVTFFGTVAVVLLLFWGGRWVVHEVQNRNQAPSGNSTAQKQTSGSSNQSPQARSGTNQNGSLSGSSGSSSNSPSNTAPKTTSPPAASSNGGAAGSPATGTTPNTGPGLINTGPGDGPDSNL